MKALLIVVSGFMACSAEDPRPPTRSRSREDMVFIRGGEKSFGWIAGRAKQDERLFGLDERPGKRVVVGSLWIDRFEIVGAEYTRCVELGGCEKAGRAHDSLYPATVTWAQADRYCRWRGARLPSDVEWETTARGGDDRLFPWGDEPMTNCFEPYRVSCTERWSPLGGDDLDRTVDGVRGMFCGGNEWVSDNASSTARGVRGGERCRSVLHRTRQPEHLEASFRCVRDAP